MNNVWIGTDWHLWNQENDPRHPYRSISNLGRLSDHYAQDIQADDLFIYLGDLCDPGVTDPKKLKAILHSIPGYKVLCKGNHDVQDDNFYLEAGFDQVCDICIIHNMAFSHKPIKIPPWMLNVHGHLHTRKISTLGYQHVNAFDTNFSDHPILLEDLLDKAIRQKPKDWEGTNLSHVTERFEAYTSLENDTYHNILDLTEQFSLIPIDEAASGSFQDVMELKELKSPKELSDWMRKNIRYSNFTKLKTDVQILKSHSGSCHDQVAFAFPRLNGMDLSPKVLFFIAYKEGETTGGMTHSLIYWTEADGETYWFENAWAGAQGIHKFRDFNDLKKDITERYNRMSESKRYPSLDFKKTNIRHFKPGTDLKTLVDDIYGDDNPLDESASTLWDYIYEAVDRQQDPLDEILFSSIEQTKDWLSDDDDEHEYREEDHRVIAEAHRFNLDEMYMCSLSASEATSELHTYTREEKNAVANKYGIRPVGDYRESEKDEPKDPDKRREELRKQRSDNLKHARKIKKRKAFVRKVKSKLPGVKNEDATFDGPEIDHSPLFGDQIHFFGHQDYHNTVLGENYQFALEDQNLRFFDVLEESTSRSKNEKLYPVYIMLVHSGTLLATAIKKVTNSHFSHSSISFDVSMTSMYSFGRKSDANPFVGAFKKEDIREEFFTERTIPYALYVVPCTKNEIALMKKRLDYFIKNSTKFRYDFTGLFKNYFGIADNPEYKWFCSRFVADILNAGRPSSEPYVVEPSLMKPEDFQTTTFARYVTGGFLSSYDADFVERVTNRILRTEQLRRAQETVIDTTVTNESTVVYDLDPFDPFQESVLNYQLAMLDENVAKDFISYLSSFKVRFDKEGNVIITRREYDQLDAHFHQSVKLCRAYQKAGNVEGIKDELCKVYYMIELINTHYLNPKVKNNPKVKSDLKKSMMDLRSVMLNMFQQNLKYVTAREPQFNFQTYYDNSKYGRNTEIPKSVLSMIGKAIVTMLR